MESNFLKLNTGKTQLKLFYPSSTIKDFHLIYNHCKITPTDAINMLGLKLGPGININFSPFVAKKVQVCNFHLRNLINITNSKAII